MIMGFRAFNLFKGDWTKLFAFAQERGFGSVQLNKVTERDIPAILGEMERTGISVSSIGAMSFKLLGPDEEEALQDREMVREGIRAARELGAPCVSQFAGSDPRKSFEENVAEFKSVFEPLAEYAGECGIKLAVENCPLINGTPPVVHNFAYSPYAWDCMFEAVPSPALGLELDTGHLPYVGVDIERCIREYAAKIYHVHLKDCRIDPEQAYRHGKLGHEFYEYAVPGEGDIDFREVLALLAEIGYEDHITLDLRPYTEETISRGGRYIRGLLDEIQVI